MKQDRFLQQFQMKVSDVKSRNEHFHMEIELLYILEGSMELVVGEQQFSLKKDDVVVVNENKRHSYTTTEGSLFCEISIPYEIIREAVGDTGVFLWCNSTVEQNEAYDILRGVLRKMLNQYVRGDGETHSFAQIGLFYNLLEVLSFHFLIAVRDKISASDKYDERIDAINNYVRSRYNEQISLNELSKQLYLSNAYLSRFFKKNYGMNFAEYLTNIRLFHAVDDLVYTDTPITRIAVDNGFSSVTLFNKAFKNVYGETPKVFRNKSRQERPEGKEAISSEIQEKLFGFLLEQKDEKTEFLPQRTLEVHADTTDVQTYTKNWNKAINMGRAHDFLEAGMQEHALLMKRKFGFHCMRIWNIFSEEMFVSMSSSKGIENFRNFDIVLDFFVENDIIPYLELSAIERFEISNFNEAVLHERGEEPQLLWWKKVLEDFLKHVIQRYGRATVEKWKFDIWDGWQGEEEKEEHIVNYLKGFAEAYHLIKDRLPNSQVGGCGSTGFFQKKRLIRMLELWTDFAPMPDFFSVKLYGYAKGEDGNNIFAKRTTDQDFVSNDLDRIKQLLDDYHFPVEQIYVEEWSQSLSNRNLLNDSCFRGAFNMRNMIQCIGKADLMVYSGGSDRISEYYDTKALLFGGLGMLTKDSIIKPSGYTCLFMNQLYEKYIQKSENSFITTDDHGAYGIVCHNCKKLNYYYYIADENELRQDAIWQYYEDTDGLHMNFRLHNVENGVYQIQIQQINENSGSIVDQWKAMNYYDDLPREVVQYLQRMSQPQMSLYRVKVEDGELYIPMKLLANEIAYISVEKLL